MEKRDYKHGRFCIATSLDDNYMYEDYLDFCLDNDIEPEGENSAAFYNWCNETALIDYEADIENIKYCKQYNVPVIITGELGLWNGNFEIEAVRKESVYDAIQRCIGRDIINVEIFFDNGEIEVNAYHHDGCNTFTIKALSKKGIAKRSGDYNKQDTKRLPYLYAI